MSHFRAWKRHGRYASNSNAQLPLTTRPRLSMRTAPMALGALLVWLEFFGMPRAGELEQPNNQLCQFAFKGPIVAGDLDKLDVVGPSYFPVNLCLDSNGGDLEEGLRIFKYIWDVNIDTIVLPEARCESACAIAFMGGSNVQGTDSTRQIERAIFPGARLGFHSPSLKLPPGQVQRTEVVDEAYLGALRIATRLFDLSQI